MSRYPSESVARFDQQFRESEAERNARLRKKRMSQKTLNRDELIAALTRGVKPFSYINPAHQAAAMLRADAEQLRARDEEIAGFRKVMQKIIATDDFGRETGLGSIPATIRMWLEDALQEKSRDAG